MHLSPPAGGVRAGRHPDPRRPRRHRRGDRQQGRAAGRWPRSAEDLRAGSTFADAVDAHPDAFPRLLPRHPAVGRAHRQPRHRARPAVELPRARPRGQAQDQGRAHLPGDRRRDVRRRRSSCSRSSCCRSSRTFFDGLDAELPLPTRILLGVTATSSATGGGSCSAPSCSLVLGVARRQPHRAGRLLPRPAAPQAAGARRPLQLRRARALLPDPVLDGRRRRAAARGAWSSRADSLNNRVYRGAPGEAREAMIEGEGLAGPLAAPGCSPARPRR